MPATIQRDPGDIVAMVDRAGGPGGYLGIQVLPFGDPLSFTGYMAKNT